MIKQTSKNYDLAKYAPQTIIQVEDRATKPLQQKAVERNHLWRMTEYLKSKWLKSHVLQ